MRISLTAQAARGACRTISRTCGTVSRGQAHGPPPNRNICSIHRQHTRLPPISQGRSPSSYPRPAPGPPPATRHAIAAVAPRRPATLHANRQHCADPASSGMVHEPVVRHHQSAPPRRCPTACPGDPGSVVAVLTTVRLATVGGCVLAVLPARTRSSPDRAALRDTDTERPVMFGAPLPRAVRAGWRCVRSRSSAWMVEMRKSDRHQHHARTALGHTQVSCPAPARIAP
jgi:hypothetical protein